MSKVILAPGFSLWKWENRKLTKEDLKYYRVSWSSNNRPTYIDMRTNTKPNVTVAISSKRAAAKFLTRWRLKYNKAKKGPKRKYRGNFILLHDNNTCDYSNGLADL